MPYLYTPACMYCGKRSLVELSDSEAEGYRRWQAGELIQTALPMLSPAQRELLLTGTHPACWEQMVPEDEEEM